MRKIRYQVAASLDGFIAGPDGEYDWIPMDPDIDFKATFAQYDTLLMGRRTYEPMARSGRGATPGMRTVVVSRTLRAEDHPDVTVLQDDLAGRIGALRAEDGKDIWLFGGGQLFGSLARLGLVDTVEVALVPVLLGQGVPLSASVDRVRLRLTGQRTYPKTGIVLLEYAVVSGGGKDPGRKRARTGAADRAG